MQRDGHVNRRTQDKIRAGIKAEKIAKKLENHILGRTKLTSTQVRAAEILLRKVTPDLSTQHIDTSTDAMVPLLSIVRPELTEPEPDDESPEETAA